MKFPCSFAPACTLGYSRPINDTVVAALTTTMKSSSNKKAALHLIDSVCIKLFKSFCRRCPISIDLVTSHNNRGYPLPSLELSDVSCHLAKRNMAAPMVRWLRGLYVFFLTCLLSVSAFLNLEELNEMKYGIQILTDPVIMGQVRIKVALVWSISLQANFG